jgi:hypothetical protein
LLKSKFQPSSSWAVNKRLTSLFDPNLVLVWVWNKYIISFLISNILSVFVLINACEIYFSSPWCKYPTFFFNNSSSVLYHCQITISFIFWNKIYSSFFLNDDKRLTSLSDFSLVLVSISNKPIIAFYFQSFFWYSF